METPDGNTSQLTRDQLPDDTAEILEALAVGLGMTRGRHFLKVEFKDGRLQQGEKIEILTRSAIVAHDAARSEG